MHQPVNCCNCMREILLDNGSITSKVPNSYMFLTLIHIQYKAFLSGIFLDFPKNTLPPGNHHCPIAGSFFRLTIKIFLSRFTTNKSTQAIGTTVIIFLNNVSGTHVINVLIKFVLLKTI